MKVNGSAMSDDKLMSAAAKGSLIIVVCKHKGWYLKHPSGAL